MINTIHIEISKGESSAFELRPNVGSEKFESLNKMRLSVFFLVALVKSGVCSRQLPEEPWAPPEEPRLPSQVECKQSTPPTKPWILITGVTGILGNRLAERLILDYNIIGLSATQVSTHSQCSIIGSLALIKDAPVLIDELKRIKIDKLAFLLHAAASKDENAMVNPGSYSLNVEVPKILQGVARRLSGTFIFFSTNYIFKGRKESAGWPEETIQYLADVHPTMIQTTVGRDITKVTYPQSKRLGEELLNVESLIGKPTQIQPHTFIIRFPGLYDDVDAKESLKKTTFGALLKTYIDAVSPYSVDNCQKRCPTKAVDVATFVETLMSSPEKYVKPDSSITVLHYASLYCVTKYEILKDLPHHKDIISKSNAHCNYDTLPEDDILNQQPKVLHGRTVQSDKNTFIAWRKIVLELRK